MRYNYTEIEKKWQKKWEDEQTFRATDDFSKPKFYGLVEFPYPSGHGCTSGTHADTRRSISSRVSGVCRGITCSTRWGGMRLACRRKIMP